MLPQPRAWGRAWWWHATPPRRELLHRWVPRLGSPPSFVPILAPPNPQGLADDPEVFAELKVKEIKNGRLAMVSVLAFAIQSAVTKEGPYANWSKHVADPFGYNLTTVLGAGEERVPTL
jgi:hypothetical protein